MQKVIKNNVNYNLFSLHEKYKSLFRFMVVGCINTGVDFVTFTLMHAISGYDALICQVAGYSVGIINSFILNKLWTFENRNSISGTTIQMYRFLFINIISLGISLLVLRILSVSYGLNIYFSKLLITGIVQVMNYIGYKFFVFRNLQST